MKHISFTIALFLIAFLGSCQNEEIDQSSALRVKNYEGHLHVGFLSEGKNLELGLYACGVNQLVAIAQINYYASKQDYLQGVASSRFGACTDWVGPYFVCAESSKKLALPQKFTGGWHGSNGDGTGQPTARTTDVKVFIDDQIQDGNFNKDCSTLRVEVTNRIQGYDYSQIGKELLQETVVYSTNGNNTLEVQVSIEALEDAVISRYYGLQSQNYALFDSVSYWLNEKVVSRAAIIADSKCPVGEKVNTIVLSDKINSNQLRLRLDTSFGLAASPYLSSGQPRAFSASYGKSYFNLVNGQELLLKKGQTIFWKGSYCWDSE